MCWYAHTSNVSSPLNQINAARAPSGTLVAVSMSVAFVLLVSCSLLSIQGRSSLHKSQVRIYLFSSSSCSIHCWVGVSYLVEQPPHCDLLRLSLSTRGFVRFQTDPSSTQGRSLARQGMVGLFGGPSLAGPCRECA